MNLNNITSGLINWDEIESVSQKAASGALSWKETAAGSMRVRLVEYSPNYKSADWCPKGHIIHCIEGELTIHFKNGNTVLLKKGNSLVLGENDPHIATTENVSAVLFIAD